MKKEMKKICVLCKKWSFDGGVPAYSEMTPGTNWCMTCKSDHYIDECSGCDVTEDEFRDIIKQAETCKDWEPVDDI